MFLYKPCLLYSIVKITPKAKSVFVSKPNGTKARYYLFDEYEMHYNEIPPKSKQDWHHHEKVLETLFVLEGKLLLAWKENGKLKSRTVHSGDLIEMEDSSHRVANNDSSIAKFIIIKQILSGKNKRALFKKDKFND